MATLKEEQPYAAVVYSEHLDVTCSSCFASTEGNPISFLCDGCEVVRYCSEECEDDDWSDHDEECSILRNIKKRKKKIPSSMFRLSARIFNKLDRDDARAPAFNGRKYDDLKDCCDLIEKDPQRKSVFNAIVQEFNNHIIKKVIDPDHLLLMYGKIVKNKLYISDESKDIGQGLYLGLSVHNYNRNPDAHIIFDGCKAILVSPDSKKEYSEDLSVVRH